MTTSPKIKILHLVDNLHHGGMERIIAELARRTNPDRFDTHILALSYMGAFGAGLDAWATLHVAAPMPKWSMLYPRGLANQIKGIAPDVAHLHSGVLYKGSLAASIAGVPYQVYTDHGRQNPDPWAYKAIDKQASRRVDVVVAVSAQLQADLSAIVKYPSRIKVVQNGVDTDRFVPLPDDGTFRKELGIAADTNVVGSTGRLEPVKGYAVMLEAFAQLRTSWTSSAPPVLVIVGDGSERESLERLAKQLGITDAVHFVGWRSDIERISRSFQVFCMSSHSEGTSVSLLEAMSAGICPVVTDVGGNGAVLGEELRHRLVAPGNPQALAHALAHALVDPPELKRDAIRARARVVNEFGLDMMVSRYESLYSAAPLRATAAR